MPIQNYIKPQSLVKQHLQVVPDALSESVHAFIYGPHFRLSRYTDDSEKSETENKTLSTGRLDATLGVDEVLDQDFVKVFAEEIEANVGSPIGDGTASGFLLTSLSVPYKIEYNDVTSAPAAVPNVDGRSLKAGDFLDLTTNSGGTTVRRKITDIEDGSVSGSVLVLDGAATEDYVIDSWASADEDIITAQLVVSFSGEIDSTEYSVDKDGVDFASLPAFEVPGASGSPYISTTGVGKVYLHYRALVKPGINEPIRKISNFSDINKYFGKVDMDNVLGYACSRALSGSDGREVYATRVSSDDINGYTDILTKAEQNRSLYAHCPLSFDIDVQQAVAAHVKDMSTWDKKKWRRAYVATDVPESRELLSEESDGTDFVCSIDTEGLLTVTSDNVDFSKVNIHAGDVVRTEFSNNQDSTTYQTTFNVKKVMGPATLILETAPASSLNNEKFEVWTGNTAKAQVDYVSNRSQQLGTRRVLNVWTDNATILDGTETVVVDNRFIAAEIAGLRAGVLPHQGLTRTEITSASAAPLMFTKYTEDHLNTAAASGVFVITQDLEDGAVYIRHQLTTDTDQGSLYYEDSVGTNLDDISFDVVDIIDGYTGKYNATDSTVREIKSRVNEMLHNKSRANRIVSIGPQVIDWNKNDLSVEIDPTLRDQINIRADLTLPLPLNRIIANLYGSVSFNN